MKMHLIEIDEKIWCHLQQNAEPLVDTPNSVLNRLLFGPAGKKEKTVDCFTIPAVSIQGLPKSLAQILEVVYEIEVNGCSRTQATHRVAKKRGTAPQTITDKYCRQLGKKAQEIDGLLAEPDYKGFKDLLMGKYSAHREIIDMYFDSMMSDSDDANFLALEKSRT
ncbi:MAG: hypothetical protein PVH37_23395 [Desulfobacterales bacterium]|jgi:hypothetical protein